MFIGDVYIPDPQTPGDDNSNGEGPTGKQVLIFFLCGIVFVWLIVTIIDWTSQSPAKTLFDVVKGQWEFLKHLRIW